MNDFKKREPLKENNMPIPENIAGDTVGPENPTGSPNDICNDCLDNICEDCGGVIEDEQDYPSDELAYAARLEAIKIATSGVYTVSDNTIFRADQIADFLLFGTTSKKVDQAADPSTWR